MKEDCPHQLAFTLLIFLRNIFLSSGLLILRMDLAENHNVLEVEPGPGCFNVKIAKHLTSGTFVLADIKSGGVL